MTDVSPGARLIQRAGVALDGLFPPACVICGACVPPSEPPLCSLCRGRLPTMAPPRCPCCGATAPGLGGQERCGECRDWDPAAPPCRTPFRMDGPAARLVRALKYAGWTELAPAMAGAMAGSARELAGSGAVLVPVPLAPARRRERGFNQAALLARDLGEITAQPVRELLARSDGRSSQARLGLSARRHNVAGAFRVLPGAAAEAPVLLVDDVVTTGATVTACAAALHEAGMECVGAVGFARTLPPLHGA